MPPTPEFAIFEMVHSYAKIYPNMTKLFEFNQPSKVRVKGYEQISGPQPKTKEGVPDPVSVIDSLRRTKTRLTDIVICNEFDLFCTFTFAKDRQNVDHLKRQMQFWLNNQQRRVGKFTYLIVPEFHKDGKSIHFHALFKGYQGKLEDTGHKTKRGQVSYVLPQYTLGFSTAVEIDDISKVGSYVKKYITKDMPQFKGKKRYWCSQNLTRPTKVMNPVVFPDQQDKFTEEHQAANMRIHTAHEKLDLTAEYPQDHRP